MAKLFAQNFELPKLPEIVKTDTGNELKLWLALLKAETDEDLLNIQNIGGPIMAQAIEAYRNVTASEELKELERIREKAILREAAVLRKERMDIAKGLLEDGVDFRIISKRTNLSEDEVLGL